MFHGFDRKLSCCACTTCLQFKTDNDRETFKRFFQEVQQAVDSKQLRPMIRTQYNRTAFQVPFDATVRISLDTNLAMIKENTDGQPVGLLHRWACPSSQELVPLLTSIHHLLLRLLPCSLTRPAIRPPMLTQLAGASLSHWLHMWRGTMCTSNSCRAMSHEL